MVHEHFDRPFRFESLQAEQKEEIELSHDNSRFFPIWEILLFSVTVGVILTFLWASSLVIFARLMVPYALGIAALIFIVTAIMSAKCGCTDDHREPCRPCSPTCMSIGKYSATVIISAAIVLLLILVFIATNLPFVAKAIVAFLTTTSFSTTLLTFIVMIFSMKARKD